MTSMSRTLAPTTCPAGRIPGRVKDERDLHRGVVDEDAVIDLSLLAQGFAVVSGQDDQGPVEKRPSAFKASMIRPSSWSMNAISPS